MLHSPRSRRAVEKPRREMLATSVRAVVDQCPSLSLSPEEYQRLYNLSSEDRYSGLTMLLAGTPAEEIVQYWFSVSKGKENDTPPPPTVAKKRAPAGPGSPLAPRGPNTIHIRLPKKATVGGAPLTEKTSPAAPGALRGKKTAADGPQDIKGRLRTPGSLRGESMGTMISISPFTSEERPTEEVEAQVEEEEVPATVSNRLVVPPTSKSRSATQAHALTEEEQRLLQLQEQAETRLEAVDDDPKSVLGEVILSHPEPQHPTAAAATTPSVPHLPLDRLSVSPSINRDASPAVIPPPGAKPLYRASTGSTTTTQNGSSITSAVFNFIRARMPGREVATTTTTATTTPASPLQSAPVHSAAGVPIVRGAALPHSPRTPPSTLAASPREPPSVRSHTGTPRSRHSGSSGNPNLKTSTPHSAPHRSPAKGSAWDGQTHTYITHPSRRPAGTPIVKAYRSKNNSDVVRVMAAIPSSLRVAPTPRSARGKPGPQEGRQTAFSRSHTALSLGTAGSPAAFSRQCTYTGLTPAQAAAPPASFARLPSRYTSCYQEEERYSAREGRRYFNAYTSAVTAAAADTSGRTRRRRRGVPHTARAPRQCPSTPTTTVTTPRTPHSAPVEKRIKSKGASKKHPQSHASPNVFERLTSNYYSPNAPAETAVEGGASPYSNGRRGRGQGMLSPREFTRTATTSRLERTRSNFVF